MISTADSCYSKLLLIYDGSHFHRISRLGRAGCLHWGTSKAGQAGRHRSVTEGSPCPRCQRGLCAHRGSSDTGSSDALCSWIAGVQQHKGYQASFACTIYDLGFRFQKTKWNRGNEAEANISGIGCECSSLFKCACGYECALPHH